MKTVFSVGILFFVCISMGFTQKVLVIQPGPADGKDVCVRSDIPDSTNPNCHETDMAGWTFNGNFGIDRSFTRFDLASVPVNARILSARLSLFYNDLYMLNPFGHYGDNGWLIQRITRDWEENTLTWRTQPSVTEKDEVTVPGSTYANQDYPDLDVTAMVAEMVSHPDSNFGFMFRLQTEQIYRVVLLCSSDYTYPDHRPKLVVTYEVCPPPVTGFSFFVQNQVVKFSDTSSYADSWHWDFGDGDASSLRNPEHIYQHGGVYHVCLVAADSCGPDTACHDITVGCFPSQALFYHEYTNPDVHFHDTSITTRFISRLWDFGDGTYSGEKDPVHSYSENSQVYYPCLTINDSCGVSNLCDTIYLAEPLVSFSQQFVPTTDKMIQFTCITRWATSWLWDFGDGATSALKDPLHLYQSMGNYQVCLTASNDLKSNTLCNQVDVLPLLLYSGGTQVILYPNPNNGKFKIQVSNDEPSATLKIFTPDGRIILSRDFAPVDNSIPIHIDLGDEPYGLYYACFTTGRYTKVLKIIISD